MTQDNIMRIGLDFDNTIVCYDKVFCELAKNWQLVDLNYKGSKQQLKDTIHALPDGDTVWQRLQGKVYGEFIQKAESFVGFNQFITACGQNSSVELFIVSHKTEFGHFDEKNINLRDAARDWLTKQGFFNDNKTVIKKTNVFFESTREEKIDRIRALKCTHFIDDLIDVLTSPLFPKTTQKILFQPPLMADMQYDEKTMEPHFFSSELKHYSNWTAIKNALLS